MPQGAFQVISLHTSSMRNSQGALEKQILKPDLQGDLGWTDPCGEGQDWFWCLTLRC